MYEELGGKVFYTGKPHSIVYEAALDLFRHLIPEDILMVGDTPETDVRGANNIGMSTALITKTGIMGDRVETHGFETVLKDLPSTDKPHFFIERLGA